MKEMMDRVRWRRNLRTALLFWALFLLWETVGIRTAFGAGITFPGLMDDLAVVVSFLALFAALEALPRVPRTMLAAALGLLLGAFVLANTLYFSFFRTFINVDSILLMDQLPDTSSSIWALMTPAMIAWAIVVPLMLLGVALYMTVGHGPNARKSSFVVLAFVFLALPSYSLGKRMRSETFSVSEQNALMHIARQGVERLAEDWLKDPDAVRATIAEHRDETWNIPPDEKAGTVDGYPIFKVPTAPAGAGVGVKNVVLVLMESTRGWETGLGTGLPSITPNLQRIASDGLLFKNAYANGHQTVRGEVSTLCSQLPHVGGGPIYLRFPRVNLRCLPQILADRGYQTHWISSYTANYGNKREFLTHHGIQNIHDKDDIEATDLKYPHVGWGASDEDLARFAVDVLDQAKEPFFAEVMTLSNHHPFNHGYPVERPTAIDTHWGPTLYRDYLHGIHYTDYAIGQFIDRARTRPWFHDTLFIFVGDHGQWHFSAGGPRKPFHVKETEAYFRTPMIFYAPEHLEPEVRDTLASQIDVAPTVLDLLGISAENAFMGVSLFADIPEDQRFALMGYENGWSIRQGHEYCYAVGHTCFEDEPPLCPPGEKPEPAPHACFRLKGDLLTLGKDDTAPFSLLEPDARAKLVRRGLRLVESSAFLLRTDSLAPPDDDGQVAGVSP